VTTNQPTTNDVTTQPISISASFTKVTLKNAHRAVLTIGTRQRILLGRLGVLQLGVVKVLDAGLDLRRNLVMLGRHSGKYLRVRV